MSLETVSEGLAEAAQLESLGALEAAADRLARLGRTHRAAALAPLRSLLDRLAITEGGIVFRYVPGGTFRMGDDAGEPDEGPAREVTLRGFYLAEVPLTWVDVHRLLGWEPPPSRPPTNAGPGLDEDNFDIDLEWQIRRQYCESKTYRATDWHVHAEVDEGFFGRPARSDSAAPRTFDEKPAVAVSWEFAQRFASAITPAPGFIIRLPTEAEWERAARGLFEGAAYPWGDASCDGTRADYGRFEQHSLLPSRAFAPNDFGLYAMAGSVWEWCEDDYDARFYAYAPSTEPLCKLDDATLAALERDFRERPRRMRVLRGGSWADDPGTLRVAFRSANDHGANPNTGVRLLRARHRCTPTFAR